MEDRTIDHANFLFENVNVAFHKNHVWYFCELLNLYPPQNFTLIVTN